MQKKADIVYQQHKLFVAGELDFFNVMSIYKKSLIYFKKNSKLNFDFSLLKSNNSAALALIVEWIKFAEAEHKSVHFENISAELMTIAKVVGIDKMIRGQS